MLKCFKFLFLNLILLQLFSSSTQSQTIEPKFDVLPVVTPRCIFQDSFGFIWIGTFGGVLRYDGYTLKHYSNIPYDSTSLSNNWVFAINEDKSGNLWIGTVGGGLNYFDRRTEVFTRYNSQNLESMSNSISRIMVNEDESLWLGTGGHGLIWFNKDPAGKIRYTSYPLTDKPTEKQFFLSNTVLDFHKDKEGLIWIASAMDGLIRFNPETGEMIKFKHDPENPKSISSNSISSVCEDDFGNLWLGTGDPELPPSHGKGLNMYNRETGEFIHFTHNESKKNGLCSNSISSLLIDHSGTMWIGSWGNYLNSISVQDLLTKNNPEFTHYTNLARDVVVSLYEDRLYNIWIGVFGMELYKIDHEQKPFAFYGRTDKFPDCLTHSNVSALCVDHSGKVWFGTRGLDGYDPRSGRYTHYTIQGSTTGLIGNWITGIQEDDDGQLWIATRNGGINIFNPENGSVRRLQHHEEETGGLVDNSVLSILKRPNGDFWIATSRAIVQLYEKKTGLFYNYEIDPEKKGDLSVKDLCEDGDGILWIGTMNSGMYSLKTENNKLVSVNNYLHNPKDRNSLSNLDVTDILHPEVIDTNALWLATIIGLNRFDLKTKKFTHFFQKDGLASDLVLRVLEDNNGNIWCATIEGISVYDIRTGKIKSYGKGDGMPFTDFSNLGKNADKGPDGQLFFAGVSGALSFYPDQLTENPNIPPIVFTDFKIFQESVKLDTAILFKKSLTLSHHQNAFSFEFAALNFTNPEKNQYAYKMEGFIDEWIDIGNERRVSFTNLDPGKYVFRVKGSNNHGVWNTEGASIRVIITPPWWKTGWAYFVYTLLLGTLLFGTVRFELQRRQRKLERQLQREQELRKLEEAEHRAIVAELERKTAEARKEAEKEQMRSRIASDLHDEIGSNLSSIALIGQVLLEKVKVSQRMKERLQEIPRIARLTAESMRDIVWFINPENDDWDKFLAKMRETASMMLEIQDFTFNVPEGGITLETDLNFRRNLYLIYKECLQNIIKHSRAQKVEIELRQKDNSLILRVGDDGVGFDTGREYSGNGLKNLRRRAADIGGKLEIISEIGEGTTVTLKV